jgi:transcriptional regulator with XRE-family HTH domain
MLLFMDTIERVIGQEVRRRREAAGVGQSVVAMYARQFGVAWTRATVAAIELGRKQLRQGELALMALFLEGAGVTDHRLSLDDLIPEDDRPVELAPGVRMPLRAARALLLGGGEQRATIRPILDGVDFRDLQACDTSEQRAALALRVRPRAVVDAAYRRWDHSLSMELLRRLQDSSAATTTTDPRRLQAIKGHITRELLDELRPLLKAATKKKKKRRRTQ